MKAHISKSLVSQTMNDFALRAAITEHFEREAREGNRDVSVILTVGTEVSR